ncbi:MAG: DUF899 domain-containing protein [Caulobacter sp.]|nr:DUF899 domain-containing protein [Caulobacter sp.]
MSASADSLAALRTPRAGESADYAAARTRLLAEEIALQRHIDQVAELRRALPPGPEVTADYRFRDVNGAEVGLADLFGDKTTLLTYFWMYGPQRERPCPMCTNLLGPLDANAEDLRQRVAVAVLGRSPVERQVAFATERGWSHLIFHQTVGDAYALDFGGLDPETGWEFPIMAVFTKAPDGKVRLFWKGEMTGDMADEGKDPRGGPDFAPLWLALDLTPEGRGESWYPKLDYY